MSEQGVFVTDAMRADYGRGRTNFARLEGGGSVRTLRQDQQALHCHTQEAWQASRVNKV